MGSIISRLPNPQIPPESEANNSILINLRLKSKLDLVVQNEYIYLKITIKYLSKKKKDTFLVVIATVACRPQWIFWKFHKAISEEPMYRLMLFQFLIKALDILFKMKPRLLILDKNFFRNIFFN